MTTTVVLRRSPAGHLPKIIAQAWPPTVRSAAWRVPAGAAALGLAMIVQQRLARPDADASSFLLQAQLMAAMTAAATPALLADPAADLLATSPTPAAWRLGIRSALMLVAWGVIWGSALAVLATAPGPGPAAGLTRHAVALLAVGAGAAALRGTVAAAAAVGVLVFASLLLPDAWTLLADDPAARWRLGAVGAGGVLALVRAGRDPARRHRSPRSRPPSAGLVHRADRQTKEPR